MLSTTTLLLGVLALTHHSIAAPTKEHIIEKRHIILQNRQADVSELLQLASQAGITGLPTDPTVLLSLGPLAATLANALPTPSVLSVLETAAPSDFVSQIINNPSYASSFEAAFSEGSSPSWFNALPTEVKSYLHTYEGFGILAGAAGGVKSVESATATATGGGDSTASGSSEGTGSATAGGVATTGSVKSSGGASSGGASSGSGASSSGGSATGGSSATSGGTGTESSSATASAAGGGASSASSQGGAAAPTGALAAGVVGVFGILGAAVLL